MAARSRGSQRTRQAGPQTAYAAWIAIVLSVLAIVLAIAYALNAFATPTFQTIQRVTSPSIEPH